MRIIEYEEFIPDSNDYSHSNNSNINKEANVKDKPKEIDYDTSKDESKFISNKIGNQLVSSESNKILIIDGEESANFCSNDNAEMTSINELSLSLSNSNTNNSNKHSNNQFSVQNNQFSVQNNQFSVQNNQFSAKNDLFSVQNKMDNTIQEVKDLPAPRNNLKKKFNFNNLVIEEKQMIKLPERKVYNIDIPSNESTRAKNDISGLTSNGESSTNLKSKGLKTKRNLELNHLEEEEYNSESNIHSKNPPKKYEASDYTNKRNFELEFKELEAKFKIQENDLAKNQILLSEKDADVKRYSNELRHLEYKLEEFAKIKQIEIEKNLEALTHEYEQKINKISHENNGLKSELNVLNLDLDSFQQEYTKTRDKFEAQVILNALY